MKLSKKILIILFLIVTINAFSQEIISKQLLKSIHRWISDDRYLYICFENNNEYYISFLPGEHQRQENIIYGQFQIKNNQIILKYNTEKDIYSKEIPSEFKKDEVILVLKPEKKKRIYSIKLVTKTGYEFYGENTYPKVGEKREEGGKEIIILKETEGIINYNAHVREGPGLNFEINKIIYDPEGKNDVNNLKVMTVIVKGWKVIITARTTEKEKISDMHDYWYYCKLKDIENTNWTSNEGWIYGGLIDIE